MTGKDTDKARQTDHETWEPDREIEYYYSREHRLNNAPFSIKKHNEHAEVKPARPGFFRSFIGGRGNFIFLLTIMIICGIISVNNILNNSAQTTFTLGNNSVILSIMEEQSILILSVKKEVKRGKNAYTGAVDITASPVLLQGEDAPTMSHRLMFSGNSREEYFVTLPFENDRILVILKTEYETIARTIRR